MLFIKIHRSLLIPRRSFPSHLLSASIDVAVAFESVLLLVAALFWVYHKLTRFPLKDIPGLRSESFLVGKSFPCLV